MFWKDGLSKNSRWNMIFLDYLERWYFFRKIYFFFGRKMKDDLSQEIHGNMIIYVYMYKFYKYDITLLQKKKKKKKNKKEKSKMTFFRKNTLKGDWHFRSHSRKSFNDSLHFYKVLRHFHILLSSAKKQKKQKKHEI